MTGICKVNVAEPLKHLQLNLPWVMLRQMMIMFEDIHRFDQLVIHRDVQVNQNVI